MRRREDTDVHHQSYHPNTTTDNCYHSVTTTLSSFYMSATVLSTSHGLTHLALPTQYNACTVVPNLILQMSTPQHREVKKFAPGDCRPRIHTRSLVPEPMAPSYHATLPLKNHHGPAGQQASLSDLLLLSTLSRDAPLGSCMLNHIPATLNTC